jgi:hypothetical protein
LVSTIIIFWLKRAISLSSCYFSYIKLSFPLVISSSIKFNLVYRAYLKDTISSSSNRTLSDYQISSWGFYIFGRGGFLLLNSWLLLNLKGGSLILSNLTCVFLGDIDSFLRDFDRVLRFNLSVSCKVLCI